MNDPITSINGINVTYLGQSYNPSTAYYTAADADDERYLIVHHGVVWVGNFNDVPMELLGWCRTP